eukprot:4218914-Alexandrium_andersonii.AAC.1
MQIRARRRRCAQRGGASGARPGNLGAPTFAPIPEPRRWPFGPSGGEREPDGLVRRGSGMMSQLCARVRATAS